MKIGRVFLSGCAVYVIVAACSAMDPGRGAGGGPGHGGSAPLDGHGGSSSTAGGTVSGAAPDGGDSGGRGAASSSYAAAGGGGGAVTGAGTGGDGAGGTMVPPSTESECAGMPLNAPCSTGQCSCDGICRPMTRCLINDGYGDWSGRVIDCDWPLLESIKILCTDDDGVIHNYRGCHRGTGPMLGCDPGDACIVRPSSTGVAPTLHGHCL